MLAQFIAVEIEASSLAVPSPVMTQIPGGADPNVFWRGKTLESVGWGGTDRCLRPLQFPTTRQRMSARFSTFPISGQPNWLRVSGVGGAFTTQGDSGGPLFWTAGDSARYLIGSNQQCVSNTVQSNYSTAWATGGADNEGRQKPNLSAWYKDALKPGLEEWSDLSSQPPSGVTDIAVCSNRSVHALAGDGSLLISTNFGESPWRSVDTLPTDTDSITCARNNIYFQKDNKEVWLVNRIGEKTRVGRPRDAQTISGTEDAGVDFSYMWALNEDRTLWFNENGATDATWQRIGRPVSAREIAAISRSQIFALNNNGSFWINQQSGRDDAWKRLPNPAGSIVDIAATLDGPSPSDRIVVFALTSTGKVVRSEYMKGGGQIPNAVQSGDRKTFRQPRYANSRLDWCFRFGNQCDGTTAATAFCRLRGFSRSLNSTIEQDIGNQSPTYVLGAARTCASSGCDGFSTITCVRE